MTTWVPALLHWLDGWVRTSGFGGAVALIAALIAYAGTANNRRHENRRAREARWWEQARWAATLTTKDDPHVVEVGIQALTHLLAEAHDAEAGRFAKAVFEAALARAGEPAEANDEADNSGRHRRPPATP